jgi:hypothetical protein
MPNPNPAATSGPAPDSQVGTTEQTSAASDLLISLVSLPPEGFEVTLSNIALAFPGRSVTVVTPDTNGSSASAGSNAPLRLLPYAPAVPSTSSWVLTAADFINTFQQAREHEAGACLILGAESQSLRPDALRALATAVLDGNVDLAIPHYQVGSRDGLVNSAILYPVTRALYGARPRFPLAVDLGLSLRMAERLATAAQRFTSASHSDALIWPVSEACSANYTVLEVDAGQRALPQPTLVDLNSLLAEIAGSLFADVEAKASFWQRARTAQTNRLPVQRAVTVDAAPDVTPMLEAFNLAYANLNEIWSLVLPPNSQLALKRLAQMPPASFRMGDSLWARIIYDFILAYRLRTINRGHLLGALTPLYLAWVASHFILAESGTAPERHVEEQAAAFEADKPYLVSRWRWPDRFNP